MVIGNCTLCHGSGKHDLPLAYTMCSWLSGLTLRRLWVLQEAMLSVDSICYWGDSRFMLSPVLRVAFVLFESKDQRRELGEEARKGLRAARDMYVRCARQYSTWNGTLTIFRESFGSMMLGVDTFQVTDPRDSVYATAQLWRPQSGLAALPPALQPDYSKSTRDVHRDATRYILESESIANAAWVLSSVEHRTIQDLASEYPTWTLHWDRQYDYKLDPRQIECEYTAGFINPRIRPDEWDYRRMLFEKSNDPNMLRLYVCVIGSVSSSWAIDNDHDFAFRQVLDTISLLDTDESATAEILTAGNKGARGEQDGFSDRPHKLECYRRFVDYLGKAQAFPRLYEFRDQCATPDDAKASRYYFAFDSDTAHRSFFRVSGGYLGCGPQLTREGDVVVIAKGAYNPYVLRPVGTEYQHLGPAYVHGLMNSEIFDMDVEWCWVDIR